MDGACMLGERERERERLRESERVQDQTAGSSSLHNIMYDDRDSMQQFVWPHCLDGFTHQCWEALQCCTSCGLVVQATGWRAIHLFHLQFLTVVNLIAICQHMPALQWLSLSLSLSLSL